MMWRHKSFWSIPKPNELSPCHFHLAVNLTYCVHAEGRVQIEGSRGAEIVPELAPRPGDRVIRKWRLKPSPMP